MKKLMLVLALAVTVLVAAAGLILPETVASMQDKQMHRETVSYEMEQRGFRSASHLKDSLQLVYQNYSQVDLKKGNILNEDSVWQLAEEMLKNLNEKGIAAADPEKFVHHDEKPFLGITPDNSLTAVLWQCRAWNDNGESAVLVLDDNSGAVIAMNLNPVSFFLERKNYGIFFEEEAYLWMNQTAEVFAEQLKLENSGFLTDGLDVSDGAIDRAADRAADGSTTEYSQTVQLEGYIRFSDGNQEDIYLPVYLSDNRLTVGFVNLEESIP